MDRLKETLDQLVQTDVIVPVIEPDVTTSH